jgi:L-ascorbate metabolism protein UlaG (beta-lactamase superfamily)
MSEAKLTHIGGPTLLIEVDGWRVLTDPTFDPAGGKYNFGWGTSSRKTTGPAIAAAEIGPLDAILVSHDQHDDNLDSAGRKLLPSAGTVVTTAAGARRLGGNAVGLKPWETTTLEAAGKPPIVVTATPCRHGPPLSKPIVGDVTGFHLLWRGLGAGPLWISGDTVIFGGLKEMAERLMVGTAVVHLGGVRFPISGPLRYTMTGAEAAELCGGLAPRTIVPIHYEGWTHFREGRAAAEAELTAGLADGPASAATVTWLEPGAPSSIEV